MHAQDPAARLREFATLDDVITARAIDPVFQPIVDLATGEVLGYESLARGPHDSPFTTPAGLFGSVASTEQLAQLDALCQQRALKLAEHHGFGAGLALFINVEPAAVGYNLDLAHVSPPTGIKVFIELTERALTAHPAALFELVRAIRSRGWGIAIDDVGADKRSLALLPLIEPDIIKLDLRLVHDQPTEESARIVAAVNAHAERCHTPIIAEGIETEDQRNLAIALGATLGQGWHLGRPAGADTWNFPDQRPREPLTVRPRTELDEGPFAIVADSPRLTTSRKPLLLAMTRHLESQAASIGEPGVILATFQTADRLRPFEQNLYAGIADESSFVGVMAAHLPEVEVRQVRQANLEPDDPVRDEWDVVALGPHYAVALIAQDVGLDVPEPQREFRYVLTHDRDIVVRAARSLMARFAPIERF